MIVPVKGTGAMNVDLRGIAEGDVIALVAEPTNKFDPHAIRVEHGGRLVGYLAKELAARIKASDFHGSIAYVLPHPETGVPAGLRISIERTERRGPEVDGTYYRYNGRSFVRATAVLKTLAKPALIGWAAKTAAGLVLANPETYDTPEKAASGIYSASSEAKLRGSAVHLFAENVSKGTPIDLSSLPEEYRGYGAAFQDFMQMYAPKPIHIEATLFSEKYSYAGTTDLIATLTDGCTYILDFKTAKNVYPENGLQLAAYRHADFIVPTLPSVPCSICDATGKVEGQRCESCAGGGYLFDQVAVPLIDKAAVVLLGSDGEWSITEVDTPFEVFLHLLEVWRWTQRGKS